MAKKVSVSKNRPIGVKILSILGFIGAGLGVLFGLLAVFAGPLFFALMPEIEELPWLASAGAAISLIVGIILIVFSLIGYFISRGLWDGKEWARIVTLVFSWISGISALFSLDVFTVLLEGVIIWYLQFRKDVVKFFK